MLDKEQMVKLVESCGVSLYDTEIANEYDKKIFRIYITSKEGISLDKCAEISRILSPIFDLEPPLEGEYLFEVSSPGIERKLTKPEHFTASIGEKVKVKLTNKEKFIGLLESFVDNVASVRVENELKQISLAEIESIRTYFEW
ncbi:MULTISPECIES: ribosome maturation factor [unclassified Sulfurospirillum]|uniref:ribosome maturation factor n=1 Tax=unclassified Sulfurospirillum TaxID=2618290 RepID=UPI0005078485|nr:MULTISPECIES: ribosome maturation factor [unclassified Sulfurospirillum]KFL34108.1 ribosome maturation factor RimP [Sulfurospirillum sp. SCADC]